MRHECLSVAAEALSSPVQQPVAVWLDEGGPASSLQTSGHGVSRAPQQNDSAGLPHLPPGDKRSQVSGECCCCAARCFDSSSVHIGGSANDSELSDLGLKLLRPSQVSGEVTHHKTLPLPAAWVHSIAQQLQQCALNIKYCTWNTSKAWMHSSFCQKQSSHQHTVSSLHMFLKVSWAERSSFFKFHLVYEDLSSHPCTFLHAAQIWSQ